jgi:peptidoglycan/LPS O-acetylase OafA/YrhL
MAPKLLADYAVGFGVSLLLSALNASPGQPPVAYRQTAGFLSAISYSLYAFHFPLCVFLVSLLLRSVRLPFLGYTFGLYAVVAGGIVLIATLLHAAFEARTEQVRRVVLDRLVVAQTRFTRPRKME